MPTPTPAYPFEHPAAKEASKLFKALNVNGEDDYRRLPMRDRIIHDVTWFEIEVMNGGVDQYLSNSIGDHAAECLESLDAIGAKQSHALLKHACKLFPQGMPPRNWELRQEQLRKIVGNETLDDRLAGEIEVDLYKLLLDHVRQLDKSK